MPAENTIFVAPFAHTYRSPSARSKKEAAAAGGAAGSVGRRVPRNPTTPLLPLSFLAARSSSTLAYRGRSARVLPRGACAVRCAHAQCVLALSLSCAQPAHA